MKVLKNYAYNLSYQLLVILLPIITTPYVTRVFSSDDLGTYGYFNSIVTYFILLATLGVANYGTKVISGHRNEINKNFWGIYSLSFVKSFKPESAFAPITTKPPNNFLACKACFNSGL